MHSVKFLSGIPIKYAKLLLAKLEEKELMTPELRKLILDSGNECKRELELLLSPSRNQEPE